jgi:hypothetical protein
MKCLVQNIMASCVTYCRNFIKEVSSSAKDSGPSLIIMPAIHGWEFWKSRLALYLQSKSVDIQNSTSVVETLQALSAHGLEGDHFA